MIKTPIEVLAECISATLEVEDGIDFLDAFQAMEPLLSREQFIDLAGILSVCPIHYCDIEICIDDQETKCKKFQN